MLKYRLISGASLIAFVLALFWADGALERIPLNETMQQLFRGRTQPPPGILLCIVLMVLIPLCVRELATIFRNNGIETKPWLISIAAMACTITIFVMPRTLNAPTGVAIIASVLVGCFLITPLWQTRWMRIEGVVAAAGATMFAVAYLGLMAGFYLAMRRWHSAWVVLAVLLITKSGDIGAYFTGRAIGKHKLIPWLSPGKTWEGLFGGIAFATLVAYLFATISEHSDFAAVYRTVDHKLTLIHQRYDPRWAAVGGALLAIVGHAGDLTMSLFKRDAGLKDSGTLIPGMGGVLDVLDSPLLVAPVAYWMLEIAVGIRASAP